MHREKTKDEIIEIYRKALEAYADPNKWFTTHHLYKNIFSLDHDICKDDCAGAFLCGGEIARQALGQASATAYCSCNEEHDPECVWYENACSWCKKRSQARLRWCIGDDIEGRSCNYLYPKCTDCRDVIIADYEVKK